DRPRLARREVIDVAEGEDVRIDGGERREHPRLRPLARTGRARQQAVTLGDEQHDGARFEYVDAVLAVGRHFSEGLAREITGRAALVVGELSLDVGEAGFLECPAHGEVAYLALEGRRRP